MINTRDCKHGHLARSCELCEAESDLKAARRRERKLKRMVRELLDCSNPLCRAVKCKEFAETGFTVCVSLRHKRVRRELKEMKWLLLQY